MAVNFDAKVVNVTVKAKERKEKGEDGGMYITFERVGRLTLEFDGESVDVAALGDLIHGRHIGLVVEDTQKRF